MLDGVRRARAVARRASARRRRPPGGARRRALLRADGHQRRWCSANRRARRRSRRCTTRRTSQGIVAAQSGVPRRAARRRLRHRVPPDAAAAAYTYAIDARLAAKHRMRRYGFHGTSHAYVSRAAAAQFLGRPVDELNMIVLHLGNGASACAVAGGRSVDTSMGLTPLEGLVMGTRSGDIDPAVLLHLQRARACSASTRSTTLLNKRSGLLGLGGANDMRDVVSGASRRATRRRRSRSTSTAPDPQVRRRLPRAARPRRRDRVHRRRRRERAVVRALGRSRAWSGSASSSTRSGTRRGREPRGCISTDGSTVAVLVVPTNEELEIARQTLAVVGA